MGEGVALTLPVLLGGEAPIEIVGEGVVLTLPVLLGEIVGEGVSLVDAAADAKAGVHPIDVATLANTEVLTASAGAHVHAGEMMETFIPPPPLVPLPIDDICGDNSSADGSAVGSAVHSSYNGSAPAA